MNMNDYFSQRMKIDTNFLHSMPLMSGNITTGSSHTRTIDVGSNRSQ